MKFIKFIIGIILLSACSADQTDLEAVKVEVKNVIYKNELPVDGCDWHFSFVDKTESIQWVEDIESKSKTDYLKTEAMKATGLPKVEVILTYQLTGKNQKVNCGWNTTTEMPEIKIIKVEIL